MSSMPNWEQTITDVSARLKEFGAHSPDTLRGVAMLGNAGNKTNRLEELFVSLVEKNLTKVAV